MEPEWKLYETGEIYHVINDPLEKILIAEKDLNPEQQKLIATFREVFPKMVKVDIPKPLKEKKIKNPDKDEDL